MGIVRAGIPEELTLYLKGKYSINTFVETGTYLGHTAQWAAQHFETHTIEMSEK